MLFSFLLVYYSRHFSFICRFLGFLFFVFFFLFYVSPCPPFDIYVPKSCVAHHLCFFLFMPFDYDFLVMSIVYCLIFFTQRLWSAVSVHRLLFSVYTHDLWFMIYDLWIAFDIHCSWGAIYNHLFYLIYPHILWFAIYAHCLWFAASSHLLLYWLYPLLMKVMLSLVYDL